MHSISSINAMNLDQFTGTFAGVYESSPWVVKRAWPGRPFQDAAALQSTLRRMVEEASTAEQDALIRAHPDLGGRLAREGRLTADSTREQSRLGLDRLGEAEHAEFTRLNDAYQSRFHFPFIICVGLLADRRRIHQAFLDRLGNSPDQERREALRQIHLIAALRLSSLVEGFVPPAASTL